MCLSVPGKLVEIYEEAGMKMGRIDYNGTINIACLEYVPEIQIGQYAVVHAGFAISFIDEEEAAKSFDAWREYKDSAARDGVDVFGNKLEDDSAEKDQD